MIQHSLLIEDWPRSDSLSLLYVRSADPGEALNGAGLLFGGELLALFPLGLELLRALLFELAHLGDDDVAPDDDREAPDDHVGHDPGQQRAPDGVEELLVGVEVDRQ